MKSEKEKKICTSLIFFLFFLFTNCARGEELESEKFGLELVRFFSGINSADPELRAACIKDSLSKLYGIEADTLRALSWIKENKKELRETLLEQMVTNSYLEREKIESALSNMTVIFPDESKNMRNLEFREAFKKRTAKKSEVKIHLLKRESHATIEYFSDLVNLEILGGSKEKRKEAYVKLKAAWGRSATEFRLLLWATEPDPALQKFLLLQAINESEDVRYSYYKKYLIPMIKYLPEEQQKLRIEMIEEIWKTKIEKTENG